MNDGAGKFHDPSPSGRRWPEGPDEGFPVPRDPSPVATVLLLVLLCTSSIALAAFQSPLTAALDQLNRGNVFEAIRSLKLALRENPQANFYLSGIYTRMGRYDTAYRYLSSAIQANPRRQPITISSA